MNKNKPLFLLSCFLLGYFISATETKQDTYGSALSYKTKWKGTKWSIVTLPLLCTSHGEHLSSPSASAGKWLPLTWQKTQLSTWRRFTQAPEGSLHSRPFCIWGPWSKSPCSLGSPTQNLFENSNILEQVSLISSVLRCHQCTQFPFTQRALAQLGKSPVQNWGEGSPVKRIGD